MLSRIRHNQALVAIIYLLLRAQETSSGSTWIPLQVTEPPFTWHCLCENEYPQR